MNNSIIKKVYPRVRIKLKKLSDLSWEEKNKSPIVVDGMHKYFDTTVTVLKRCLFDGIPAFRIKEDNGKYAWKYELIKEVIDSNKSFYSSLQRYKNVKKKLGLTKKVLV